MSPDRDLPAFQRTQFAFTAHIRDPAHAPIPDGIPPRRMAVYTELLFNNIDSQMSGCFPVLREITADDHWHALIRDYMVRHRATTPLFTEVALEFLDYLQNTREPHPEDHPFMLELAHYEYVELAVAIADDGPAAGHDPNGDLLAGSPLLCPTAWNLTYAWPVHEIGPDYLPDSPPETATHLVVYRDRLDAVHFVQINGVTQRLIQLLKETPDITGLAALTAIAEELGHPNPETVIAGGRALLADLRERNVILGTRQTLSDPTRPGPA
jgi:uncharacterized protein